MRFHFGTYSRENSLERAQFPIEELGEKCEKHIFLQQEAEGELGHDFQTGLGVILSWLEYQGATITAAQKPRKVRLAFIAGTHFQKGTAAFIADPSFRKKVQVRTVRFWARFSRISGTDFEEEIWHFSQGKTARFFEAVRMHLMQSVQYFC